MAKRRKDGSLDLRTKEGKNAEQISNFLGTPMGGCLLRLILIVAALLILGEIFPSFGEWLRSLE